MLERTPQPNDRNHRLHPSRGGRALRLFCLWLMAALVLPEAMAATSWVTKRFGEAATSDVTGVTSDATVDASSVNKTSGTDKSLYYRWQNHIIMRFDLSAIPAGTRIRSATLRMFYDYDYYDNGTTGVTQPIYRLEDPDGTGVWLESEVTFNSKRKGVPWSASGNLNTVVGPKVGEIYFKNWFNHGQAFLQSDVTEAVAHWVEHPESNLGLVMFCGPNFNKRIAAHEHSDPLLRPYLEVTYEAEQDEEIARPTGLRVVHSDGQSFLTWREAATGVDETEYYIYRADFPITSENLDEAELIDTVYQGSSWIHDGIAFRQPELSPLGIRLEADSGLYVHTARAEASAYYAVTTVVEGNENREIIAGENATTQAVRESVALPRPYKLSEHAYGYYTGFVVWMSDFNPADPDDAFGYTNRPSAPFLFSVAEPVSHDPNRLYPLTIYLHAVGKDYFASEEGSDPSRYYSPTVYGGYTIAFNDFEVMSIRMADGTLKVLGRYLETDDYGYSFYSGWNSNYVPGGYKYGIIKSKREVRPFEEGRNVMYVQKSIRYVTEWMLERSPWSSEMDPRRVYVTGGSMGGSGSLALAVHHPDLIAAANAFLQRTVIYWEGAYARNSQRMFGSVEMNVPMPNGESIWEHMDIASYLRRNPDREYPPIRLYNGRKDTTVKWTSHPDMYRAAQEAGLYVVAHWDEGDHNSRDPLAEFPERVGDRYFNRDQALPYFNIFQFRRDLSYPIFTEFSLDDDPGNGDPTDGVLRGGINRFVRWDLETLEDTPTRWATTLFLYDFAPEDEATVTVTPARVQSLVLDAGARYRWRVERVEDGTALQSGELTLNEQGRLTVRGVRVGKRPVRLTIELIESGDATAPDAPTGLTATILGMRRVRLSWTAPSAADVAGFEIVNENGELLAAVRMPEATLVDRTPGETLTVRVRAFDTSGNRSAMSEPVTVTMPLTADNKAPVLLPIGDREVRRGELVEFVITGHDEDDYALQFSASPLPEGAQFDPKTRQFRWIPNYRQSGEHRITFSVTDGRLTTSEEVTITVLAEAPQALIESLHTYGAFVSGGVRIRMSLADGNEEGRIWIRRADRPQDPWREMHPFVRYDANNMATSLFDLEMGTTYDVRVHLIDPDGDVVEEMATLTTRPEWSMPAAVREIPVSGDAELSAAITAAQPGDHLLLAPGTYSQQVRIGSRHGQPGAPIVLRAADPQRRPLLTGGMRIIQSSHILVHGLELFGDGMRLRGSQYCEVVDNIIREPGGGIDAYGIHLSHNELIPGEDKNFYILIMNNLLADDEHSNKLMQYGEFPDQAYYGIKLDDGVGGMTIIRGNVIRGFADGIAPGGDEGEAPVLGPNDFDVLDSWPNQNVDIHDNIIYWMSDDGIETDGHMVNGRIFNNQIGFCVNAITTAPLFPGPYFIVRNTLYGFREQAFKLNTKVAGETRNIFIYHNTVKQQPNASYCIYRGMPTRNQNIVFRNNIFDALGRVIDTDIGSNYAGEYYHSNHDFDNDLMWSPLQPGGEYVLFKWGYSGYHDNQRFNSLEAFQQATASPTVRFDRPEQRVIPQEPNGIFADPLLRVIPLPGYPPEVFLNRLVPAKESPAIDAAMLIPGINDLYHGAGPDIGAIELDDDDDDVPPPTPTPTPGPPAERKAPLTIDYVEPDSGAPDSWVAIFGTNFGAGQHAGDLYLGDRLITEFHRWENGRIVFQVPRGAASGDLYLTVGDEVSNRVPFRVRSGAVYHVDASASNASDSNPGTLQQPWATLAYAATQARAGDTVYIGDGVYEEQLRPLHSGTEGRPILFAARPGTAPVLDGSTLPGRPAGIQVDGGRSWLIFSRLRVEGFERGVQLAAGAHDNRLVAIQASGGRNGFVLDGAERTRIEQCVARGNSYAGFMITGATVDTVIEDSQALRNGSVIGAGFLAEFTADGLTVRRSTAIDNAGEGFDLRIADVLLDAVRASGNRVGVALWRGGVIRNGLVYDNQLTGIALRELPGTQPEPAVINCTVAGPHSEAGIDVMPGVSPLIINTISIGSIGPAVRLADGVLDPVIEHCILGSAGATARANLVVEGPAAAEIRLASHATNLLEGVAPEDLFQDYEARDLDLSPNSMARNFGTEQLAPSEDIERRPRDVSMDRIDVGAYEYPGLENGVDATWAIYQ